jgi:hypothetical protein
MGTAVANEITLSEPHSRLFAWGDLDGYTEVTTEYGDSGRWQKSMRTICKRDSDGKLFAMDWERGLTEYQDHDYSDTIYEVEAVEVTIKQTHYKKVEDADQAH